VQAPGRVEPRFSSLRFFNGPPESDLQQSSRYQSRQCQFLSLPKASEQRSEQAEVCDLAAQTPTVERKLFFGGVGTNGPIQFYITVEDKTESLRGQEKQSSHK